jgi:hypothetical protein
MGGPLPIVAFALIVFAAIAVPTVMAYVLFNLVRKDPPTFEELSPRHARRKIAHRSTAVRERLTTRHRLGRN